MSIPLRATILTVVGSLMWAGTAVAGSIAVVSPQANAVLDFQPSIADPTKLAGRLEVVVDLGVAVGSSGSCELEVSNTGRTDPARNDRFFLPERRIDLSTFICTQVDPGGTTYRLIMDSTSVVPNTTYYWMVYRFVGVDCSVSPCVTNYDLTPVMPFSFKDPSAPDPSNPPPSEPEPSEPEPAPPSTRMNYWQARQYASRIAFSVMRGIKLRKVGPCTRRSASSFSCAATYRNRRAALHGKAIVSHVVRDGELYYTWFYRGKRTWLNCRSRCTASFVASWRRPPVRGRQAN